jgi:deoxyribodipyrimidine photo-lyase
MQVLDRFVRTRARASQLGPVDPLAPGAEPSDKHSRLARYADGRNNAAADTSSRLRHARLLPAHGRMMLTSALS